MDSVKFVVKCDKFISVNERLVGVHKTLSNPARHEMDQLRESLHRAGIPKYCMGEGKGEKSFYTVSIVYYLKSSIQRRDLDNLVKILVDAVTPYLGFDDSKIVSYKLSKREVRYPKGAIKYEWAQVEVTKLDKTIDDLRVTSDYFSTIYGIDTN